MQMKVDKKVLPLAEELDKYLWKKEIKKKEKKNDYEDQRNKKE